jgi:prepilin-type N-terminal cleavage/methylation domain-containing protein
MKKGSKGFTLVELMVTMLLMVGLFFTLMSLADGFFSTGARLVKMSRSTIEIARLERYLLRDMRAAIRVTVSPDGNTLTLLCSADETDNLVLRKGMVTPGDRAQLHAEDIFTQGARLALDEGLLYTVTYQYIEEPNPFPTWINGVPQDTVEGQIVRKGPLIDYQTNSVPEQEAKAWEARQEAQKYSTLIARGWQADLTVRPVFSLTKPLPANPKVGRGVRIYLVQRVLSRGRGKVYDYTQLYSTELTSRAYR